MPVFNRRPLGRPTRPNYPTVPPTSRFVSYNIMILTFPRPDIRRRNLTLTLNTIIGILCVEDNHISSSFQYFASLPIPRREYLESSFYLSTPLPKTIRNKHYKDGFSIQIRYQHCPLPHDNANDGIYHPSTSIQRPQTLS